MRVHFPGKRVRRSCGLAALATLTVATLNSCSDSGSSSSSVTQPGAQSADTAAAPAASPGSVPAALAFTSTFVGGQAADLSAYAGKPVAFWFWAPT